MERKNLKTVARYLECRRQCVLVFSMASTTSAVMAEMRGVAWKLGHEHGECIGYLAWLDSGHVCRVLRVAEDDVQIGCPDAAPWYRSVARGRSRSRSRVPPARVPRGSPLGRAPRRRAAQGRARVRDGVDAQMLARMSREEMEALATSLRRDGEQGVPSSQRRDGGKRVRVDPDAYRAALAAYLNLDLQAVGQAGAAARSDARAKEMLDQIEEHVFPKSCRGRKRRTPRRPSSRCGSTMLEQGTLS